MRRVFIILLIVNSSIFAFEDKYMSCTLINEYGKEVSFRQAKAQEKVDIGLLITEDKLYFDNYYYIYDTTINGMDTYGTDKGALSGKTFFLNKGNQLILGSWDSSIEDGRFKKNYSLRYKYKCKQEKSYLNKMKILSLSKLFAEE